VGVLTDRDLAIRVVAKGADPYATMVEHVMTAGAKTVRRSAPIEDALALMRAAACRRLLVIGDDGRLQGLVSLDDILSLLASEFADIGRLLQRESPAALASR
jgi:CBS domain-containing protein